MKGTHSQGHKCFIAEALWVSILVSCRDDWDIHVPLLICIVPSSKMCLEKVLSNIFEPQFLSPTLYTHGKIQEMCIFFFTQHPHVFSNVQK